VLFDVWFTSKEFPQIAQPSSEEGMVAIPVTMAETFPSYILSKLLSHVKPVFREFQPKGEIRQPDWVSDLMMDYWK